MQKMGKNLRTLRETAMLSQVKLAQILGSTQSSINRYESGQATPTVKLLRAYADYFDVSMDYIFARTENPQGKLYSYEPKIDANSDQMQKFIEMCFDPNSPVSTKMKQTLMNLVSGGDGD